MILEARPRPVPTADGSWTLQRPGEPESYHSRFGAVTEARLAFVVPAELPARAAAGRATRILEVGYGAGLNFGLAAQTFLAAGTPLAYTGIDPAPAPFLPATELHWPLPPAVDELRRALVERGVARVEAIAAQLERRPAEETPLPPASVDVVFLDAFSPRTAPTLWRRPFLDRLVATLRPGGVLVTYVAQGAFRRALRALGLAVEALPGPPGKREITRARRPEGS